jgi:hypothetical protein
MRLHEFEQPDPEKARVDRMKDTANVAKDKAKQLSQQARASADTLKMKQSKQKLSQLQKPVTAGMIRPQ